jgi:2-methylcitrate dehydratase PrpD
VTSAPAAGRNDGAYRVALLDWLACAAGGRDEPAARAALGAGDGPLERVAYLGTAGHVLDFDDTYLPGLAHLSAPVAPAALGLGAHLGAGVGRTLDAYAAGFEAMGALARASHPALYEGGWHPTAVCGVVGAATAAARLLGLDAACEGHAVRLAALRAGGLRAAFGSDGKSLQVGMAAADGVLAARQAAAGARVSAAVADGPAGFEESFGARWAVARDGAAAVTQNWIKPWPCCLMAHSAVEAAATARRQGVGAEARVTVAVHPRARRAAAYDDVSDGLQAKFSLPYLVAYTLLRGEPSAASFAGVDDRARALAADRIRVRTDPALGETEAVLEADGEPVARVAHSLGSPERPMSQEQLAAKVEDLGGPRLAGALGNPQRAVADLLSAAGLDRPADVPAS